MKVVFILGSSVNPNSLKRVDEFYEQGYDIAVYGFSRDLSVVNHPSHSEVTIVGVFTNATPYMQRIKTLYRGIKKALVSHKKEDCLYYLVGMDIAILFRLQSRCPYIYEEPDLVHTNIKNGLARYIMELIDKRNIKHSVLSVFRSAGFLRYHYPNYIPDNVFVIPNRLSPKIAECRVIDKKPIDFSHLKIGYVGFIRYKSILNFVQVFCSRFPKHEFHFWGTFTNEKGEEQFASLKSVSNCFFHGSFKSPYDLPDIYSQIDLVLSTYDVSSINVRYAEPNKIYEAIYFETPIIVSSNTFLAEKVSKLDIGYNLNAMEDSEIVSFVNGLEPGGYNRIKERLKSIDKKSVINNNEEFFDRMRMVLK